MSRGGARPGAGRPRQFGEGVAVPRTVRLPEATWEALAARAKAQGLTIAQTIATLVAQS